MPIDNLDVSRSVDQLCTQMSLANVKVTPFASFSDVYDFIAEFELNTTGVSDDQRIVLLAKAFPPGRHRSWFEVEIKPIIKRKGSWAEAKKLLIARFGDSEDRDKYFAKLKELKFDESSGQSLMDFIDDLSFIFNKSFPGQPDDTSLIRYLKASLPKNVRSSLNLYSEFRDAATMETLKKAARRYEDSRTTASTQSADTSTLKELSKMIQELVSGLRKDNETTRNAVMMALNGHRNEPANNSSSNPAVYRNSRGSPSPNRMETNNGRLNLRPMQSRSPSPNRNRIDRYGRGTPPPRGNSPGYRRDSDHRSEPVEAFDTSAYYAKYGRPKTACSLCGSMHWSRHCFEHLNE